MSLRTRWKTHGVVFESPIDLRGCVFTDADPEVQVEVHAVPRALAEVTCRGKFWEANPVEALIEVPEVARYHVLGGQEIRIHPEPNVRLDDTGLLGVPVAACLMQRGWLVLHGAGLRLGSSGVVLLGRNGAGKSSTVAALEALGAGDAYCDNLATINHTADRAFLQPGPSTRRLWKDMANLLGVDLEYARRLRPDADKFVVQGRDVARTPVPLRTLVSLSPSSHPTPRLTLLAPLQATAAVIQNVFRIRLAQAIDPRTLERVSALVAHLRVYKLERPQANCSPFELARFLLGSLPIDS